MSLCKNSHTLTFSGVRADDGGQPEELTLVITKFCVDPSPLFGVESFDARLDVTFEFIPLTDGAYHVQFVGGVSGLIEEFDFLVKTNANKELGRIAKKDLKTLQCNDCLDDQYMFTKALIAMADSLFGCERMCEAADSLAKVVEDDCGNKIEDCGCS